MGRGRLQQKKEQKNVSGETFRWLEELGWEAFNHRGKKKSFLHLDTPALDHKLLRTVLVMEEQRHIFTR